MNTIFRFVALAIASAPIALAGCAGPTDDAATAQSEAVDQTQQPLGIDLCSETAATPHATLNDIGERVSLDDQNTYGAINCRGYIVEFGAGANVTDPGRTVSARWKHTPATEAECERLRVRYTYYSYNNGTWTTNGTVTRSGHWTGFCYPDYTTGGSVAFTAGTKWRVKASAWEENCDGSDCYNDYKRMSVSVAYVVP